MPPSGNYSLCIAQAATRATAYLTTMKKSTNLLAISIALVVRWYNATPIARWRRFMAFLEATGCHHRASICSDNINRTCQRRLVVVYFIINRSKNATNDNGRRHCHSGPRRRRQERHRQRRLPPTLDESTRLSHSATPPPCQVQCSKH